MIPQYLGTIVIRVIQITTNTRHQAGFVTLMEFITPQLQAAYLVEQLLLENLLNFYGFSSHLFFVSRTNYQGNRSILKIAICRTDERDCLEVIEGNCLSSSQLFAGLPQRSWSGGPRLHIAACLQKTPAATCALACFAALSCRLWYVPQAYYPTGNFTFLTYGS